MTARTSRRTSRYGGLAPGKELVYFLSQHIGAPAKSVVKPKDAVKAGQLIAEAGGFVSAPVHASVSGTVKKIEQRRMANGSWGDAIIIENDGKYESVEYVPADPEKLTSDEIIAKIREAGIVGMGGAGFPTAVKLSPKEPDKIEYVLVNGAECEPYLTSDYRRMLENPEWLVEGLSIILRLFPNAVGRICIEDNKPEAVKAMTQAAAGRDKIEVAVLKTKYPQGAERSLINAVTGRKVNSKMLPADAGCIVDNVDTVCSIYRAVALGQPLIDRVFTVSGDAVANPGNFNVPVGMSYKEIVDAAGGFIEEPEKIISGGPMMGFAMPDLEVPVTKTSGAITCFIKDQVSAAVTTPCISCGRCLSACPARLAPQRLIKLAKKRDAEGFEKLYGMECVSCGSCSYVCPAKQPLAQEISMMRKYVLDMKRRAKA